MNKPYQLVVFDWEGTLGDTLGQILETIASVANAMHFGTFDALQARQYVDLGLVMTVKKLFPQLLAIQHEQLLEAVQRSLLTNSMNTCLIPGALQIIQHMHDAGLALAIATNKGQYALQRALQETGLEPYFQVTRSAGQTPAKPCPQMLEEIMDECGVLASDTLMVGDSIADIEMALQLNVDVIGVDFYHQQAEHLAASGALMVFDDYRELAVYLGLPAF